MVTFKDYFMGMSVAQRGAFARRCQTSMAHLRNIAYGKTCGESLAILIDRESAGAVPVEVLRPDVDWGYLRATQAPVEKILATTRSQLGLEAKGGA